MPPQSVGSYGVLSRAGWLGLCCLLVSCAPHYEHMQAERLLEELACIELTDDDIVPPLTAPRYGLSEPPLLCAVLLRASELLPSLATRLAETHNVSEAASAIHVMTIHAWNTGSGRAYSRLVGAVLNDVQTGKRFDSARDKKIWIYLVQRLWSYREKWGEE